MYVERAGVILKKCDRKNCRPQTNKACAAGTCQHTCDKIKTCPHAWTLRHWVNGKQREQSFKDRIGDNDRVVFGSGEKFAKDARLKLAYGKREQGRTFIDHSRAGRENFGDACSEWIERLACSDSTRQSYLTVLRKWVRPALGHLTLAQAANACEEAEKLIGVTMAHLSASRKITARRLVTGTLDKAARAGKIAGHRMTGIEIGEHGEVEDRAPFVFPSYRQVAYLAGKIGICVWLMRGCGLRICEALGVEKSDFREGGKVLRVSGQSSRDGHKRVALKHRKPGAFRDVPVPGWLWEIVRDLPDGALCPGLNGRRYAVYGTVYEQFVRFAPRIGIPAGFHPHSLRHLFASVMLAQGIQITDLAKWLGHSNINVTYAIYGHLVPSATDRAIAALDAEYSQWREAA